MNFIKKFPRAFATILVALLGIITNGATNFENGLDFFTDFFSGMGIVVAVALPLLVSWIGDRVLVSATLNATFTSIAGLIGIALVTFLGADGATLQAFINEFLASGEITLAALAGVLIKIFGDRRIGVFTDPESVKG